MLFARLCALLIVATPAFGHYDGDPSQDTHIYRFHTGSTPMHGTPFEACVYYASWMSQSYSPVAQSAQLSGATWQCTIRYTTGALAETTTNANAPAGGNESHCPHGQVKATTGCTARSGCPIGTSHTWPSNRMPWGFNIPDEDGLPSPFAAWRGCSMKLQGASQNGECTSVTYQLTGTKAMDEDGMPLMAVDGDPYSSSIPPACDPASGATTPVGTDPGTDSAQVCASRAGSNVQLTFAYTGTISSNPTTTWLCVAGCKAVPKAGVTGVQACTGEPDENGNKSCSIAMDGTYPFPDQSHYGRCTDGTVGGAGGVTGGTATGGNTGGGTGPGGTGTDMTATNNALGEINDSLNSCNPARGDICSEQSTLGVDAGGDAGLEALDGLASDVGGEHKGEVTADPPAFATPLTGWASGVGGSCEPVSLSVQGHSMDIDYCQAHTIIQTVLYWLFATWLGFHAWNVWRRGAE